MNGTDPALLAALQLLTQKITDLPSEIITANADHTERSGGPGVERVYVTNENWAAPVPVQIAGESGGSAAGKGKGGGAGKEKDGALANSFGPILARFAAVVGPLAVLGQVLGATTSGFQTLGKAVQLFATSVAPVLLPVTLLLATAFTAAADVISATLLPGMEGFIGLILSIGIPVLITFIEAVQVIAEKLFGWAKEVGSYYDSRRKDANYDRIVEEEVQKLLAEEKAKTGEDRDVFDKISDLFTGETWDRFGEAERRTFARLDAGEGENESEIKTTIIGALNDVVKSFSLSVGPKAQISGLEGVGKAAQLAALNQDPLEARMLKTQQQILGAIQGAIASIRSGGVYTGTGGDFGGDF